MMIRKFSFFLGIVCRRIPIKKLKNRIYNEMREHMEDMLDVYLEAGEEREAAIEKVVKDMGNPIKINKQLRRAHRLEIVSAYASRAVVGILIITFLLSLPDLITVASEYRRSSTKEEIEADLAESEHPYKYCGKIERNGRNYIFYTAETPDGYKVKYYESIKLFNRYSVYDRFAGSGGGDGGGNLFVDLGFPDISKETEREVKVYFAFKETAKVKYFQFSFNKIYGSENGDNPDEMTSELFPIPKPGEFIVIDAPEGYRFSGFYYLFDENKQKIQNSKDNDWWGGTAWKGGSKKGYLFW